MALELHLNGSVELSQDLYRELKKEDIQPDGTQKISLKSGDFFLNGSDAQRLFLLFHNLDQADGKLDGQLNPSGEEWRKWLQKYGGRRLTIRTVREKFSPSFLENQKSIEALAMKRTIAFSDDEASRRITLPPEPWVINLATFYATESDWNKQTFKKVAEECVASALSCYYVLLSFHGGITFFSLVPGDHDGSLSAKNARVTLSLGHSNSVLRWQHIVRHERGHILLHLIAKKWGKDRFYHALKKWAKSKGIQEDFFIELEHNLVKSNSIEHLQYYVDEAVDPAFIKAHSLKRGLDLERGVKKVFLQKLLSVEGIKKISTNQDLILISSAAYVHWAKSLGLPEWKKAKANLFTAFPEHQKRLEKYFKIYQLAEEFFLSEEAFLKKIDPHFLQKIK